MAAGTCVSVSGCAAVASSPPSLIGLDVPAEPDCPRRRGDRIAVFFAAMRMSAFGTKQTQRDVCLLVRFRGKADIRCRLALMLSAAFDPKRTKAEVKSRSAAGSCVLSLV